ncbi:MAG: GPW/gp25 family protein [Akkermansia sp.]|nr:GPW/gp25 family protein [Akkermansia sp.]
MPATAQQRESSKYLPCLLTRLTDARPFTAEDGDFYSSCFSLQQLKQDILVNLNLLLNARTAPAETAYLLKRFPQVARSGFHFGIDSITGLSLGSLRPARLAEIVRRALIIFEPRLEPESIEVKPALMQGEDKTAVHLAISSRLAVKPMTQDVFFRLRVDMETGEASLND